jgi:hypothetical protein
MLIDSAVRRGWHRVRRLRPYVRRGGLDAHRLSRSEDGIESVDSVAHNLVGIYIHSYTCQLKPLSR